MLSAVIDILHRLFAWLPAFTITCCMFLSAPLFIGIDFGAASAVAILTFIIGFYFIQTLRRRLIYTLVILLSVSLTSTVVMNVKIEFFWGLWCTAILLFFKWARTDWGSRKHFVFALLVYDGRLYLSKIFHKINDIDIEYPLLNNMTALQIAIAGNRASVACWLISLGADTSGYMSEDTTVKRALAKLLEPCPDK